MTPNINIDRIHEVLKQWHEAGRATFEQTYTNLDYDSPFYQKRAVYKTRYVCLDQGNSGAFLVDMVGEPEKGRKAGNIYRIKSKYGVPNFKKLIGNINTIDGKELSKARWY